MYNVFVLVNVHVPRGVGGGRRSDQIIFIDSMIVQQIGGSKEYRDGGGRGGWGGQGGLDVWKFQTYQINLNSIFFKVVTPPPPSCLKYNVQLKQFVLIIKLVIKGQAIKKYFISDLNRQVTLTHIYVKMTNFCFNCKMKKTHENTRFQKIC